MRVLSSTDFSDHLGHPFPVLTQGARIVMTLTDVTMLRGGIPGGRQPFSLTFRGPAQPPLPQAMYDFEHPVHGVVPIFIVPIGADAESVTYEAVFA